MNDYGNPFIQPVQQPYYQQPMQYQQQMQYPSRQQYQQPMQIQPAFPSIPPQPATSGLIWVNGRNEAENYPVAENNAVALWDVNSPFVYVKERTASGKPNFHVYELTDRTGMPVNAPQQRQTEMATRDEVNALSAKYDALAARYEALAARIVKEDGASEPTV